MFRKLTEAEILRLKVNNNSADNWEELLVVSTFFVDGIKNTNFSGSVYIGKNVIIENVGKIKNCTIGDNCIIRNVGEIIADKNVNYAFTFPVCSEQDKYLITVQPGMNTTDVFTALYSAKPDLFVDSSNFETKTIIQSDVVVQNVSAIRNSFIGSYSIISETSLIEDSWISEIEDFLNEKVVRTKIGANVVLQRVIIGKSSEITSNSMIFDSMIGENCIVSQGARLYESVLGDCSFISGCEIGNSFLYPFHSQHHSNSFVIAGHVKGECNIAAGATLGSNHNSRRNDGEFSAGRGFWAGLSSSIAMPSHFAPFTLLVKGDYQYPLNIEFAFSLVSNNLHENTLDIVPAYWWNYNTYALLRNEIKFKNRDLRTNYSQIIEYKVLAPDSIKAVIGSHKLLKALKKDNTLPQIELSKRDVRVLKIDQGLKAYESMILCYVLQVFGEKLSDAAYMNNLYLQHKDNNIQFLNVGGQILPKIILEELCLRKENQLKTNHKIQKDTFITDEYIRKDALNALNYFLCESVFNSEVCDLKNILWVKLASVAVEQTISFYENVLKEGFLGNNSEFKQFVNQDFNIFAKKKNEKDNTIETAEIAVVKLRKLSDKLNKLL